MSKLCEHPGCSEIGAVEYGMVPEDLLFWIAPMAGTLRDEQNVLCLRHADAMVVPRGWTLDDRREAIPRLFMPRPGGSRPERAPRRSGVKRAAPTEPVEQLVIDGTDEIERPALAGRPADDTEPHATENADAGDDAARWQPSFDQGNDLDGLLEVSSPLLARAFRGTGRPRD